ncbi:MAG: hypothetical protein HUU01_08855 [Saprospiraceae bacterium]|nr:hypothetical protein [Saprospiraceae bacterium]
MLGIILLYFIGRGFYRLAETYGKNKWGLALAGIASYYVGTFIGGIAIVFFYEWVLVISIDTLSDLGMGLLALPFGLLACWGFYTLLEKRWAADRFKEKSDANILDEEFLFDDQKEV